MVQKLFRSARKQSPWSKSGQLWTSTRGSLRQAGVWEREQQSFALQKGESEDGGRHSRPPASSMQSRAADAEEGVSVSTGGKDGFPGKPGRRWIKKDEH